MIRLLLVLLLCWAGGLLAFVGQIPARPQTAPEVTDAAVVLTGGAGRLAHGLHLVNAGLARKLLISGVGKQTRLADLLALYPTDTSNIPSEKDVIILDQVAADTLTNARQTAQWMEAERFHSLRLVTADYHMPRSRLIFAHYLPTADILSEPVFPKEFRRDMWWRDTNSLRLVMIEYHKFILTWLTLATGLA